MPEDPEVAMEEAATARARMNDHWSNKRPTATSSMPIPRPSLSPFALGSDLQNELATFRDRCSKLEARCTESNQAISSLTRQLVEAGKDIANMQSTTEAAECALAEGVKRGARGMTETIKCQAQRINSLEQLLEDAEAARKFVLLADEAVYVPKQSAVETQMREISSRMRKLLNQYEDDYTLQLPKGLEQNPDFKALMSRCLPPGFVGRRSFRDLPIDLTALGLEVMVWALTAAALCEWVFASDFEYTASQPSILLDMYRQAAMSIGMEPLKIKNNFSLD